MASQGPNSGGTFADDNAVGTNTWGSPSNAASSNNTWSAFSSNTNNSISHYLKATNFGFSIPSGATINGVVVEIERHADRSNAVKDNIVKLVKGGTVSGNDKADTSNFWPTSDTYASYGGASDLWGLSLSDSDVNASNFGVVISDKQFTGSLTVHRIDHIRITVHYTASGGGGASQTNYYFACP